MDASREDRKPSSNRLPTALAAAALFIALGSGAYAASVAPNSVGPKQIQANAVGTSEIAAQAVGASELKAQAVGEAQMANDSVGQAKLKEAAVGEAQMQANSISKAKLQAGAVGESQIENAAIGQAKLKAQSVGEAQMQANSISKAKLKDAAVGEAQMENDSVSQAKLKAASVGETQLQANSVGLAQLKAAAVGAAAIANGAVGGAAIQDGSIQPADLSAAATPTLYTDNDEPGVTITGDTAIAALNLPAGNYLVSAGVEAVHTGTTAYTRLECYLQQTAPAATLDFAKLRLAPNLSASDSLIFAKPFLQGPTVLPSATSVVFRCTTTGAASTIDLTHVRMSALKMPSIVQQ
ncbi:MAG: hypothetical protein U0R51_05360 [Solirubrobacterales bacterium]